MKNFKNYMRPIKESNTLDIQNWINTHIDDVNISVLASIKIIDNAINAYYIKIITDEYELPFRFEKCDHFVLTGANIKSMKNFPTSSYENFTLDIVLNECDNLNFETRENDYQMPICNMTLIKMNKIHITDLHRISSNLTSIGFYTSDNKKLHDLSTYDTNIEIVRLNPLLQLSNITSLITNVNCNIEEFYITEDDDGDYYDSNQIDILERIIAKYMNMKKNVRKDHVMDMTIDLIDAGYEDEV